MSYEMMIPYEHVTKMGRVGKALGPPHGKTKAVPRFRKLPFQDDDDLGRPSSTPEPELNESRSRTEVADDVSDIPLHESSEGVYTYERQYKHREAYQPYVEMKLGRNMRAAPKGSIASKPLPPLTQQDLIEMLNRNNHISERQESLMGRQRDAAAHQERLEAELRRKKEEDEIRERQKNEERQQAESEALRRQRDSEETQVKDPFFDSKPARVLAPPFALPGPPPLSTLYSTYRMKEDWEVKQGDQISTQPFSPQSSTVFGQTRASEPSNVTVDVKSGDFKAQSAASFDKPETVEDVEEIAEDIKGGDDDDDDDDDVKLKDDDFDF